MKTRSILVSALALLAVAGSAEAQTKTKARRSSTPSYQSSRQGLMVGFQASLNKPMGDLDTEVDGNIGPGIGMHLFIHLKDGHCIVPRFDFSRWSGEHTWTDSDRYKHLDESTYTSFAIGADYNYYFQRPNDGWYVLGGAGFNNGKHEYTETLTYLPTGRIIPSYESSHSKTELYVTGGGGYRFNDMFGLEGRLVSTKVGDTDATWVNFSASFRF